MEMVVAFLVSWNRKGLMVVMGWGVHRPVTHPHLLESHCTRMASKVQNFLVWKTKRVKEETWDRP